MLRTQKIDFIFDIKSDPIYYSTEDYLLNQDGTCVRTSSGFPIKVYKKLTNRLVGFSYYSTYNLDRIPVDDLLNTINSRGIVISGKVITERTASLKELYVDEVTVGSYRGRTQKLYKLRAVVEFFSENNLARYRYPVEDNYFIHNGKRYRIQYIDDATKEKINSPIYSGDCGFGYFGENVLYDVSEKIPINDDGAVLSKNEPVLYAEVYDCRQSDWNCIGFPTSGDVVL